MKELHKKLEDCLRVSYTTVENAATYCIEREGSTLRLFFEWSSGREDWRNNFKFAAKSVTLGKKPYKNMSDKWRAHRGFLKVWKSIEPHIMSELLDLSVESIDIVGYSHGAAVAQLCYEYVKYNRPDVEVTGVGFGSPRVLWGYASRSVKERFKGFIVVRNGRDLVTHLPPVLFGYRHICEVMNIGESKGLIKDHYSEAYLASMAPDENTDADIKIYK